MSSVPPLKRCSTFLRLATSETASATPEDQGPTTNFAPSPSTASSVRRVEVPACVAPSRVMYLTGRPRICMPRSSSAIFMPRSLMGPTSAKAPVWSHRPRITTSLDCARTMAGNPSTAVAPPAFRISLRLILPMCCPLCESESLLQCHAGIIPCSELGEPHEDEGHGNARHPVPDHPGRHAVGGLRGARLGGVERGRARRPYGAYPADAGRPAQGDRALPHDDRQALRREHDHPAVHQAAALRGIHAGDHRFG